MKLIDFRVTNFRSINDSGSVHVSKLTTLVGRNESGKSNLLIALASLKPPSGVKALLPIKDWPRDRRLSECDERDLVVETTWELTASECKSLEEIFPRAAGVRCVEISRDYGGKFYVGFRDLPPQAFSIRDVTTRVRKIKAVLLSRAEKVADDPSKAGLQKATQDFETVATTSSGLKWAAAVTPAAEALRKALADAEVELTENADMLLEELEDLAANLPKDDKQHAAAREWAVARLPVFIYVDEYPELPGHQDINEYLQRRAKNTQTEADRNFEKLCKVADLDPNQLKSLQDTNEHETRNQLVNRASALVTSDIKRLWKDRQLKVRLNLDAQHLDTLISDPNAVYDVEVNLDDRSRGFKWFFSFFVTFAADTKGGPAEDAILLLDEPGLYLHAASQGDLLKYLTGDIPNQVIYTTHSPFMVPTDNLDAVRTVKIAADTGTTVTNDPTGDARTLFPLQTALGYTLAQSLFVGPANLVVEGVTDFWIVSAVSEYLRDKNRPALPPEVALTPAGGAQKISYMVALLASQQLNVLVLLDDEKQARNTSEELVKGKLIRQDSVIFTTELYSSDAPAEADIEDLLNPSVYEALVREAYKSELKGTTLALNSNIPRIVKRFETAFSTVGKEFNKTRAARLFLSKMAVDPEEVMPSESADRFQRLFELVAERFQRQKSRENKFG